MIDDHDEAMKLIRRMEESLPIPARPTGDLIRVMKQQGAKFTRDQELLIQDVFYAGDVGGISCDVTPPEMKGKAGVVCSLTQLEISPDHPLAREIRAYQKKRKKGLAREGRESGSLYIPPPDKQRTRKRGRRKRRRH